MAFQCQRVRVNHFYNVLHDRKKNEIILDGQLTLFVKTEKKTKSKINNKRLLLGPIKCHSKKELFEKNLNSSILLLNTQNIFLFCVTIILVFQFLNYST